jgi:hypothetical protein
MVFLSETAALYFAERSLTVPLPTRDMMQINRCDAARYKTTVPVAEDDSGAIALCARARLLVFTVRTLYGPANAFSEDKLSEHQKPS